MSHFCDKCGMDSSGWPYLAAHLATICAVAATALWVYGIGEAWDVFRDAQAVEPWWGVQAILAISSALAGLLVGIVVFFVGEGIADKWSEMRPSWSAVRRKLRKLRSNGRNCRWCGCRKHGVGACAAPCANAPGRKVEAGSA